MQARPLREGAQPHLVGPGAHPAAGSGLGQPGGRDGQAGPAPLDGPDQGGKGRGVGPVLDELEGLGLQARPAEGTEQIDQPVGAVDQLQPPAPGEGPGGQGAPLLQGTFLGLGPAGGSPGAPGEPGTMRWAGGKET